MQIPANDPKDQDLREVAAQAERENPLWIVMFGSYTQEFVCFPRFAAPPGTVVIAKYPAALTQRFRAVERVMRIGGKEPTAQ